MDTVWVLGDQLSLDIASLEGRDPASTTVLLVESEAKINAKRWHRKRLHLILTAMHRFADDLRAAGYTVDHRRAATLPAGLAEHRRDHAPVTVTAMSPSSWDAVAMLRRCEVDIVPNDRFLCSAEEFAVWASGRRSLRMEDFYRERRLRTGVLMDGDEPVDGRWNFDHDNREPPPRDGRSWPAIEYFELDDVDHRILELMGDRGWGDDPIGIWPTSRTQALQRLDEFVEHGLPVFGPHEDAMLAGEWKLAHSVLASSLNLGLLHPGELVEAAEVAYREGRIPIASAEGFVRQVMGWREYVWGTYWLWMPEYRTANSLAAQRRLPPVFQGDGETAMACVSSSLEGLGHHGWNHHIERLMVLGNLVLLTGTRPDDVVDWMWRSYVDGAEWVMLPNVLGMALHADGGMMATKPYAAGGAYINRMSDHCKGCRFDPRKRTGDDACPYTTLYWDFLARNRERLSGNHRMSRQLANLDRLADLDATRDRAREVLALLDAGRL